MYPQLTPAFVWRKETPFLANAHSMILCHNHPSGNLQPSDSDNKLTKNLRESGRLMDIPLLDHLIITNEGFYSFADEGTL